MVGEACVNGTNLGSDDRRGTTAIWPSSVALKHLSRATADRCRPGERSNPKHTLEETLELTIDRPATPEAVGAINGTRPAAHRRGRVFLLNPEGYAPAPGYRGIVSIAGAWVHIGEAELPPCLEQDDHVWQRVPDVSIPANQVELVEWAV
jgi:hypothetical protein